jgi:hypothetical protein
MTDIRDGPPATWRLLSRRACAVFGSCAAVAPLALPALASAFTEYLLAWRGASPDGNQPATVAVFPQRLHDCVARLESVLCGAEQSIEGEPGRVAMAYDHTWPDELAWIEDEAAQLLTTTRDLLRTLDTDRNDTHRMRLALVAAWGRYDDALAALRQRAPVVADADLAVMVGLRDALRRHLESARSLRTQPSG